MDWANLWNGANAPVVHQYGNDQSLLYGALMASPQTQENSERFIAAMDAATGGKYNEMTSEDAKQTFRNYLLSMYGRDDLLGGERKLEHARASYPGFVDGGPVTAEALTGSNPPGSDTGYAALQPGEFVLNREAVNAIGKEALARLNQAHFDPRLVNMLRQYGIMSTAVGSGTPAR